MSEPVYQFANPNGRPDKYITENEARLWLLSKADRASGGHVQYDAEAERWVVVGVKNAPVNKAACAHCGVVFVAKRATARFCTAAHRQAAQRGPRYAKNPPPTRGTTPPFSAVGGQ